MFIAIDFHAPKQAALLSETRRRHYGVSLQRDRQSRRVALIDSRALLRHIVLGSLAGTAMAYGIVASSLLPL